MTTARHAGFVIGYAGHLYLYDEEALPAGVWPAATRLSAILPPRRTLSRWYALPCSIRHANASLENVNRQSKVWRTGIFMCRL